jgi:ZIP family zinc transporter
MILPYLVGAAAVGALGGLLPSLWTPTQKFTSYIQHFAAGVVIAAVALQVAPEVQQVGAPPVALLGGFALGGLFMIGVKWMTLRLEEREREKHGRPWGLALAAAVDTALDGAIIGAGFAMAEGVGIILSIALALELFSLTLSVASSFRHRGGLRWTSIGVTSAVSLLLIAGGLAGSLGLRDASDTVLAALLAFGAAALLYLVTEELLVETRLPEETLTSTAMFFLGFLAIFAFVLVGTH